jgi:DnaJ-class molecular chaperone
MTFKTNTMGKPNIYKDPIIDFLPEGVKPVTEIIVCPDCGGHGSHSRRDLDQSRLVDSMIEDGDDEGLERYYSGAFDVKCQTCHGRNVVQAVCKEWVKQNHPQAFIDQQSYWKWEAQDRAYAAAEQRACGHY